MKDEPEHISKIRQSYLEGAVFDGYNTMLLFQYIDQLQGLLDGTLMYNNESQIVPKVAWGELEIGDMWYSPITFAGPLKVDYLFEDTDE